MEGYSFFQMPKQIYYGRRSFGRVGTEARKVGGKALIISDNTMIQLGYIKLCEELLEKEKVDYIVYSGVESEPTDQYVGESLNLLREEACDVIISLGGGSCIDTAKAVAVLATNGGYIGDYMGERKLATIPPIPHIAIPTTAGTGSEGTDVTVITNTFNQVKMMIKQPAFLPSTAIVDPLLTVSSPKSVTAATGIDALSHAIEAYISKKAQSMTNTMALSAMEKITQNLIQAYENGDNVDAREEMSIGAMQAGIAFSNSSVCLVHGMSRPIGALFDVPHGFSNAMLLPAVLEFSKASCIDQLADLGRIFSEQAMSMTNESAAEFAVESVKKLCATLQIPNLKGWGIDKETFEQAIEKMAQDAIASGSPANNPRVPSEKEIGDLYRICYDYKYE